MRPLQKEQIGDSDKPDDMIKSKEKKMEISIYALIIIVTIAFMLIFFNLFLVN